jgi:excisionase family DNA binding protein
MPRQLKGYEVVQPRLLTVDELSWMTGWTPGTIRQKVWRRELPYLKLGRNIRFKESDIAEIIENAVVPARKGAN